MGSGHLCLPMDEIKMGTTIAGLADAFAIGFVLDMLFGGQWMFEHCISLQLTYLIDFIE